MPGHVANRLQAALWREAIHLVNEGVASVEDVDTAVSAGPGLRWATMGPTLLFHLGAGEGGLEAFCECYADSFNRWFDDLGRPHLDEATSRRLVDGLRPISESHPVDAHWRGGPEQRAPPGSRPVPERAPGRRAGLWRRPPGRTSSPSPPMPYRTPTAPKTPAGYRFADRRPHQPTAWLTWRHGSNPGERVSARGAMPLRRTS
ncbi:3-hydroxyacyl-CoA dehydrogenase family protein [Streptomyces asiaticus]